VEPDPEAQPCRLSPLLCCPGLSLGILRSSSPRALAHREPKDTSQPLRRHFLLNVSPVAFDGWWLLLWSISLAGAVC
jgi:hypothetical protein